MSHYITCSQCFEQTMDVASLKCDDCGYESGMSENKALKQRIKELEAERDNLSAQLSALASIFRVNFLRLSDEVTHEEIDNAINEVAPKADEFKSRLYATEANVIKLREELAQLHLYANQCQDNLAAERNLLNRMWEASGCLAGTHVVDHIKLLKADAERWRRLRP